MWTGLRQIQELHTVVGELRLNLTTIGSRLDEVATRVAKLESQALPEALALQEFKGHVQTCERINSEAAEKARSFRRELRGYIALLSLALLGGAGFLLYHGLPYTVR